MKGGRVLTAGEIRKIIEDGGKVWVESHEYDPGGYQYDGPARFTEANVGYYVEEAGDDKLEVPGISFAITDFDPDDYDDDTRIDEDCGDCSFAIRELLDD